MKLLCLCDSPTVETGFGRVARTLLKEWQGYFQDGIDVWGVNYSGYPHNYPYRIYPAGYAEWSQARKLKNFLLKLEGGGYTHLWILQDLFQLNRADFAPVIEQVCRAQQIKSYLYFPVDAPMDEWWTGIVRAIDFPVAYTEYGRAQVMLWTKGKEIGVIPHGVDTTMFYPYLPWRDESDQMMNAAGREKLREKTYVAKPGGFCVGPEDVLLLNVNTHSRRKAVVQSLQILAELKRISRRQFKLLLHMPNEAVEEGVNLEVIAPQLGLFNSADWSHSSRYFARNHPLATDAALNQLYNTADLYLSTSLGEGWGLGITEALAAGLPVAIPRHTSCLEIQNGMEQRGMGDRVLLLDLSPCGIVHVLDNSRVRYPVDPIKAAQLIDAHFSNRRVHPGLPLNDAVKDWLDWKRIAQEWIRLFEQAKPEAPAAPPVVTGDEVMAQEAAAFATKSLPTECENAT